MSTYAKQTWANDLAGGTPLSAARMNYIEDGIEAATTPSGMLVNIKTVDGAGSGLDADTLDGVEGSGYATTGALAAHEADTTSIHGIPNTASLYTAGGTDVAVADGGTGASTASGARSNLGLGTVATQDASAVAITGGTVTGITDLAIADGGTGASTVDGALAALGLYKSKQSSALSIGTGTLTDIPGLSWAVSSGVRYTLKVAFLFQTGNTSIGTKMIFTGPTLSYGNWTLAIPQADSGSNSTMWGGSKPLYTQQTNVLFGSTSTDYLLIIEALFEPSANGTIQLQGACSSGGTTTVIYSKGGGLLTAYP